MRSVIVFMFLAFCLNSVAGIDYEVTTSAAADPRKEYQPTRVGQECSKDDLYIYQTPEQPLPSKIPAYSVEIKNVCATGCVVSNIHISCGWFSSSQSINPTVFQRIGYNDCLVNNGRPLAYGQSISFVYANSIRCPFSVSSISCG